MFGVITLGRWEGCGCKLLMGRAGFSSTRACSFPCCLANCGKGLTSVGRKLASSLGTSDHSSGTHLRFSAIAKIDIWLVSRACTAEARWSILRHDRFEGARLLEAGDADRDMTRDVSSALVGVVSVHRERLIGLNFS